MKQNSILSVPYSQCLTLADENFFRNHRNNYFEFPEKIFIKRHYLDSPASRIKVIQDFLSEDDVVVGNTAAWVHFGCVPRSNIVPIEFARKDQKSRRKAKRRRFQKIDLEKIGNTEVTSPIRTVLDLMKTNLEYGLTLSLHFLLPTRTPEAITRFRVELYKYRSPKNLKEIFAQLLTSIS